MYRRSGFERLQDIAFRLRRDRLRRKTPKLEGDHNNHSSISGSSPWVTLAGLAENPGFDLTGFRQHSGVLEIVETVGPTDGIAYAGYISRYGRDFLSNEKVARVDAWGDPMRWPAILLKTPRSFSPTTLRYLATALWLKAHNLISKNTTVIEVGSGFGGLAAMNQIVSGVRTLMVDLPPVEGLGKRMVRETTGTEPPLSREGAKVGEAACFVSCYAFTELAGELQEAYLDRWIKPSDRGLILSNAEIFSRSAGGRSDTDLVKLLRRAGKDARLVEQDELLAPTDYLHGNRLIVW